jgi:hypothetical protein
MQPFGKRGAVDVHARELVLDPLQFSPQQPAQRLHGDWVAAGKQAGLIVKRWARMVRQRAQQPLQIHQLAGLDEHLGETGRQQRRAFAGCHLGAACHRDGTPRTGLRIRSQRRQNLQRPRAGHAAIQQQQVESLVASQRQRFDTVGAGDHARLQAAHAVRQKAAAGRVVVGYQHIHAGGVKRE